VAGLGLRIFSLISVTIEFSEDWVFLVFRDLRQNYLTYKTELFCKLNNIKLVTVNGFTTNEG